MTDKIRILFLSANPWSTSRILVDKEAREIFEKLEEGTYRDRFQLFKHAALRPGDLQRLLMKHRPHIVHFSGHGSKVCKLILEGAPGKGKRVDPDGFVDIFRLYNSHVRLVLLNACFTRSQARALAEVVDYAIGISKAIGDRAGVMFAGSFYRALGFGRPVVESFQSAKAELRLIRMPRSQGIELFSRDGATAQDIFPVADTPPIGEDRELLSAMKQLISAGPASVDTADVPHKAVPHGWVVKRTHETIETASHIIERSAVSYSRVRSLNSPGQNDSLDRTA